MKKFMILTLLILFTIVLVPQSFSSHTCGRLVTIIHLPHGADLSDLTAGSVFSIGAYQVYDPYCGNPWPQLTCDGTTRLLSYELKYRIEHGESGGTTINYPVSGDPLYSYDGALDVTTEIARPAGPVGQWTSENTFTVFPRCSSYPCTYRGTIYSAAILRMAYEDPADNCNLHWYDAISTLDDRSVTFRLDVPNPGSEICDGFDNNQDGEVDEGCDDDNDDYCDVNMVRSSPYSCANSDNCCPLGGGDCGDNNMAWGPHNIARFVYPGAYEFCDGVDNDCDNPPVADTDNPDTGCSGGIPSACDCLWFFVDGEFHDDTCGSTEFCTSDPAESPNGERCIPTGGGFLSGVCVPEQTACTAPDWRQCGDDGSLGGPCSFGTEWCGSDGFWDRTTCTGTYREAEICDNIDNDCDGNVDEGCDTDGDDFCDADMAFSVSSSACPNSVWDAARGEYLLDCNDRHPGWNPNALELCGWILPSGPADVNCNADPEDGCDDDDDDYCDSANVMSSSTINRNDYFCTEVDGVQDGCCDQSHHANLLTRDCNDDPAADGFNVNPGRAANCGDGHVDTNCDFVDDCAPVGGSAPCNCDAGGVFGATCMGGQWGCSLFDEDHPFGNFCIPNAGNDGYCVPFCNDADGDGQFSLEPCEGIGGLDCNDNPLTGGTDMFVGNNEWCDGLDNNCNGLIDEGCDKDDDGYCEDTLLRDSPYFCDDSNDPPNECCSLGGGDCNDLNIAANPGQAEECDGVDNNCNGVIDEGCDDDDDNYCDASMVVLNSAYPCDNALNPNCCVGDLRPLDCDDDLPWVNPGEDEYCGSWQIDENCDGDINEGCVCAHGEVRFPCGTDLGECNFGYERCDFWGQWPGCVQNPGPRNEICDDLDNSCNGASDEGCNYDGDAFCNASMTTIDPAPFICLNGGGDCDELNPDVFPGAPELCDGIPNDCNQPGRVDEDPIGTPVTRSCYTGPAATRDVGRCQSGFQTCLAAGSFSSGCTDEILPLPNELACNGIDDNCDGQVDEGSYDCHTYCPAGNFDETTPKLSIKNNGVTVAEVDTNGVWRIDGRVNENALSIPTESFNVKDFDGVPVAAIDKSGNVHLRGQLFQVGAPLSRSVQQEMIITHGFRDLTIFDTDGNMYVAGCVSTNFSLDCGQNDLACAFCNATEQVIPLGGAVTFDLTGPASTMPSPSTCFFNPADGGPQINVADCDDTVTYTFNTAGAFTPFFDDGLGNDVDCPPITVGTCIPASCVGRCGVINDGCGAFRDCGSCCTPTTPSLDVCDGLDNDCDGSIDNGIGCPCTNGATRPCGTDTGECSMGEETCVNGDWDGICTNGYVGQSPEVCNGLDDDCNGAIDNDVACTCSSPTDTRVCGSTIGECETGLEVCGDDLFFDGQSCGGAGYVPATNEVCDGLDNDCDGIRDNGCNCIHGTTRPCGTDWGECSMGEETCILGDWSGSCGGPSFVGPSSEVCDGLDNDCNLLIDDVQGCPVCTDGATRPCSVDEGECSAGFETCSGGVWGACDGVLPPEDPETTCDDLDNNCDGQIDENCDCRVGQTRPCGNDIGPCEPGTQTCLNGLWELTCVQPGIYPRADDNCDGVDDNCDGTYDEGWVNEVTTCNNGACISQGVLTCPPGGPPEDSCVAQVPQPETLVTCNGIDDDCVGGIDDGITCPCSRGERRQCGSTDIGLCNIAYEECPWWNPSPSFTGDNSNCRDEDWNPYVGPTQEVCDGEDNDCDGLVDAADPDVASCPCQEGIDPPIPCGSTVGECTLGFMNCVGNVWQPCDGQGPVTEICDGLDNDCNTAVDFNQYEDAAYSLGYEICDGLDNDCNGVADFPNEHAGSTGPGTEICGNGIDEDCDGQDGRVACDMGTYTAICGFDQGDCDSAPVSCGPCSPGTVCNTVGAFPGAACVECNDNNDCIGNPNGQICQASQCVECASGFDCPLGQYCDTNDWQCQHCTADCRCDAGQNVIEDNCDRGPNCIVSGFAQCAGPNDCFCWV